MQNKNTGLYYKGREDLPVKFRPIEQIMNRIYLDVRKKQEIEGAMKMKNLGLWTFAINQNYQRRDSDNL